MQVQHGNKAILVLASLSVVLAFTFLTNQSCGQSNLTLGHQVLLEKGLQLKTLAMPSYVISAGGTFDLDLFRASGFNTIDLWNHTTTYDNFANANILPGYPNALNFARLVGGSTSGRVCSATYLPNLVSIQLGDEQSIESSALPTLAAEVIALRDKYPDAIIYTNQGELHSGFSSMSSTLNNYIQTVKPDMLSFTEYPFRWTGTSYYDYAGGSPTLMYQQIELYRKAGLAGLTGDGSQPIPVSMFVQTFAHEGSSSTNDRQPTESEFRLQQFAGWASGMKSVNAFLYVNLPGLNSMFFEGDSSASQTPTTQFYQYAELNRQSANLGDALVRLTSTDFRMKMGSHGTGAGVTNTLPYGVSAFDATTDPYLTGISATNLGTLNNGLPGDVLYGSYKPLDPSLVEVGSENDDYFMIVNGLSDATGTAFDCRQQIHLDFDFSTSGINSLLRLSRDTGQVEEVPLVHNGGSLYSLDLTLDGGTGDLFKYDTGSTFIGRNKSVVYREIFPSIAGANTSIDTVGWKLNYDATGEEYDGSLATGGGPLWNASAAGSSGLPSDLAGVNSNPHLTDKENGYLFFNKEVMSGEHNVLVWTDEVTLANVDKSDLAEISWYESNADDTTMRLALKIAGEWYVTGDTYTCNTIESGMSAGSKMIVDDFSSVNWYSLTFIPGAEMSRSETFVSLPNGILQAAGIYTDDMAIDACSHRFDTFEIQAFRLEDEERLPGDANGDGKVDGSDVTILANNWQAGVDNPDPTRITWSMGDFNGDGKVDGSDVTILANNWQKGVTAVASAVPEPSMVVLLVIMAGAFMLRRRVY